MKNFVLYMLMFLLFNTSVLGANLISITCVYNNVTKTNNADFLGSVNLWAKDFGKSSIISSKRKVNDSIWVFTFQPPEKNYLQQYQLLLKGESYQIFIDKNVKKLHITIDSMPDVNRPYRVTTNGRDAFAFGIWFENDLYDTKIYKALASTSDTVQATEIINAYNKKLVLLQEQFADAANKNQPFTLFVKAEILYELWGKTQRKFANLSLCRHLRDSIEAEYYKMVQNPFMIYSRHSTLLGLNIQESSIGNANTDSAILTALNTNMFALHAGLFRDFIIENIFKSFTYEQTRSKQLLNKLYLYARAEISDAILKNSLQTEYDRYIHENQLLPESLLLATKLIDAQGKTTSLNSLLDDLQKKQKKRVVIDFWASWCGPCKQEIEYSASFVDSIRQNQSKFEYLYFSIDKPEKYSAAKQYCLTHNITNRSLFLIGGTSSPLFKYFDISAIPFHVLFDVNTLEFQANTVSTIQKENFLQLINSDISPKRK